MSPGVVPLASGGRFGVDCLGPDNKIKPIDTIFKIAPKGKVVRSFGRGMFVWPHGLFVDRDGNVWVTDSRAEQGKGSVVVKFSPDGKVLLRLGKPGVQVPCSSARPWCWAAPCWCTSCGCASRRRAR